MRSFALLVAFLAVGCKTPDPATDGVVTWYGEVEPLAQRVCANCHAPDGIGPGDFTTYEGMRAEADDIEEKISAGEMPPPVSDPGCNPYAGSEHLNITEEERQMLLDWVEQGTPKGNADYAEPAFTPYFEHLDDADIVLEPTEEFTITPDEKGTQYRCFVIPYEVTADTNVTAFDVRVGNAEIVHHMLLFVDPNGDAGEGYGVPPGTTSFDCADPIMEDDWQPLHAWAPGMPPTILENGTGLKLHPGDQIVIQMHYTLHHESDEPVKDHSAYLLRTTTDTVREVQMFPGAISNFNIPAGDGAYTHSESFGLEGLPFSIAIHGVFPHMHLLGTHYEATIEREDGSETCVVRGDWNFAHQMSYMFDDPIVVHPGDSLRGTCTWDNSADNPNQVNDPPKSVHWGEGTTDEMCVFLTYVSIATGG